VVGARLDGSRRYFPATGATLAEATGRDPSTVSHHLSTLADEGLVERRREGRAVVNTLTPAAEETVAASPFVGEQSAGDD
jgi:DNA-binding transcriptional ArsR family regulator